MDTSALSSLEGLTEIGLNGRADMRPTLLRVLTDLYVQKLTHTPDEDRHYTELALRLLDSVDMPTRATVAARLARHLSPPGRVMQKLAVDLPEVSAALRSNRPMQADQSAVTSVRNTPAAPEPVQAPASGAAACPIPSETSAAPDWIASDAASELNELFFAANADERRLILLNLDVVVRPTPARCDLANDTTAGRKLEAAALDRKREAFARELAHCLRISRRQAQRIAGDPLGEPIVVAAKALNIPGTLLHRILLFVNTSVGHSVERVHALATLYDEMTVEAAREVVAIWQALKLDERELPTHQPLLAGDGSRARSAAAVQRAASPLPKVVRRTAS